jgi:hypothetical protein
VNNSARGELVEPCELCASVVNISSQKTQNNLIFILHFSPPSPFQGEGKGEGKCCGPDTGRVNENVLPRPS